MKQINSRRKFKLIKNKKWILAVVATSLLATGGFKISKIRTENAKDHENTEYAVGYQNVNLFTNWLTKRVEENNFVLLDIKDHDLFSILLQKMQLDYCTKNDIDMGLIVHCDASNLGDLYLDIEYLFSIMEKYEISYPVYLNVDSLIENADLTKEEAYQYIYAFLKKAEVNHLYVGVTGKEEYLAGEFLDYDKLVSKEETSLDNHIFQKDDLYYADLEIANCIENNCLNDPSAFKDDGIYICSGNESLQDIAFSYGLSVNDLKKFNPDISDKDLEKGLKIRIPSTFRADANFSYLEDGGFYKGIDVSFYQEDIQWENVDTDFAIIQIRDFANEENDIQFEANVSGCSNNHIPMGFYVFSRAKTIDGIKQEALYTVEQLRNVMVTYPVYLDIETKFWQFQEQNGSYVLSGMSVEETKEFVLSVLKIWESVIQQNGYIPGIYCHGDMYPILNTVSDGYINHLAIWTCGGSYYNKKIDYNDKENIPVVDATSNIGMKQISQMGMINGITDVSGAYVDVNYCYSNYEKKEKYWDRIDFLEYDLDFARGFVPLGAGLVLGAGAMELRGHSKKRRRTRR